MSTSPTPAPRHEPSSREPIPTLLARVRAELSYAFDPSKPIRTTSAAGRLDVMGGLAEYAGSSVITAPLNQAAAVCSQSRDDREIQVFSFNLLDDNVPFTLRIPLEAVATNSLDRLRQEFNEPGRRWAGYLVGCLAILHAHRLIDAADPSLHGLNLAAYSTVPKNIGAGSSGALVVATMTNLLEHFDQQNHFAPIELAQLCRDVERSIIGADCYLSEPLTAAAVPGTWLHFPKQRGRSPLFLENAHVLRQFSDSEKGSGPFSALTENVQLLVVDSKVNHDPRREKFDRTRIASFMGQRLLLEKMRELGRAAGRELLADPMQGHLANLDVNDFKRFFRPSIPELLKGRKFLDRLGPLDPPYFVEPALEYRVQQALDFHIIEARRTENFAAFFAEAATLPPGPRRTHLLDKAGHLMYASHIAETNDALLGAPEADRLVQLVRDNEHAGFYGARMCAPCSGGLVVVLANANASVDEAMEKILTQYKSATGLAGELI